MKHILELYDEKGTCPLQQKKANHRIFGQLTGFSGIDRIFGQLTGYSVNWQDFFFFSNNITGAMPRSRAAGGKDADEPLMRPCYHCTDLIDYKDTVNESQLINFKINPHDKQPGRYCCYKDAKACAKRKQALPETAQAGRIPKATRAAFLLTAPPGCAGVRQKAAGTKSQGR